MVPPSEVRARRTSEARQVADRLPGAETCAGSLVRAPGTCAAATHRSKGSRFRIRVDVPSDDVGRVNEVRHALQSHYRAESADAEGEIRGLAYNGRWTFLVAFLVVGLVILVNEAIVTWFEGRFITVLSESLIIVAWVTLWGPAETLLFSHFPARRARDVAGALASAAVTLDATEADRTPPRTS